MPWNVGKVHVTVQSGLKKPNDMGNGMKYGVCAMTRMQNGHHRLGVILDPDMLTTDWISKEL
jgi:hypothetical protein